jgi:hypothetical protein
VLSEAGIAEAATRVLPENAAPEALGFFGGRIDGRPDLDSLGLVGVAAALGRPLPMGTTVTEAVDARRSRTSRPDATPVGLRSAILPLLALDDPDVGRDRAEDGPHDLRSHRVADLRRGGLRILERVRGQSAHCAPVDLVPGHAQALAHLRRHRAELGHPIEQTPGHAVLARGHRLLVVAVASASSTRVVLPSCPHPVTAARLVGFLRRRNADAAGRMSASGTSAADRGRIDAISRFVARVERFGHHAADESVRARSRACRRPASGHDRGPIEASVGRG